MSELPPALPTPGKFLFIIARGDSFGGSSMHVQDLALRLEKDGHQAKVLVGGTPDMEVPSRYDEAGVDFECIESMGRAINPGKDLRTMYLIRKVVKTFEPDLVSTHAAKGGALGRVACLGLGRPVLYTPHCWSFVDGFRLALVYQWLEKWLAGFSCRIITVSEDERQLALSRKVGKPDQMITIHNGVHDIDLQRDAKAGGNGFVNMVMTGRFEDQKDQETLIRALLPLRARDDWHLTFVGDGPTRERNEQLCRTLGLRAKINFLGYSSNVRELLSGSDLFILASKWEGFPRSILEAMRSGLPVIASDVGGCRESVVDGLNGIIVPKNDRGKLREAIRQLLDDPEQREAMGEAGRQLFREKFTFEKMYQNYCRLYDGLLTQELRSRQRKKKIGSISRPLTE